MSPTRVTIKDGVLLVESSDLIKDARTPATKDLLKIAPFCIRVEIPLTGIDLKAKGPKIEKAAQETANKIQKELLTTLKKLVDDLVTLKKLDQQGNEKAGETAEKRVKDVSDKIEEALVDFGHDLRKGIEKVGKLQSGVKSVAGGHFRGLHLIYAFRGGQRAVFTEAYEETAKAFDQLGDEALRSAREEESSREGVLGELQEALKTAQEARDDAQREPSSDASWAQSVIQEARNLQRHFQDWGKLLADWQKGLEQAEKESLKSLGKLSKDADPKAKQSAQKVTEELKKLTKVVTTRLAAVVGMFGEYKKRAAVGSKPDGWIARLERDVATVKAMKDIDAHALNTTARQMVQHAQKM
jgi:hypothetical protein